MNTSAPGAFSNNFWQIRCPSVDQWYDSHILGARPANQRRRCFTSRVDGYCPGALRLWMMRWRRQSAGTNSMLAGRVGPIAPSKLCSTFQKGCSPH